MYSMTYLHADLYVMEYIIANSNRVQQGASEASPPACTVGDLNTLTLPFHSVEMECELTTGVFPFRSGPATRASDR